MGMRLPPALEAKVLELAGARPVPPALDVSEKVFQSRVTKLATWCGWDWYHTHDSRRSPKGFPDLICVRERVLYAELKTDTGSTTAEQDHWLELLSRAGAEVYLWRPSSWPEIEATLKRV